MARLRAAVFSVLATLGALTAQPELLPVPRAAVPLVVVPGPVSLYPLGAPPPPELAPAPVAAVLAPPPPAPAPAPRSYSGTVWHPAPPPPCGPVAPAPYLAESTFPRVVVPAVHINVEIRPGNGQTPPEGYWNAWTYPGDSAPGGGGNVYLYAHAHGSPPNSAPGLFWNLHYIQRCQAAYVYVGPATAVTYQVTNVNHYWPGWDPSPMRQTADNRLTLQTCNTWNDRDPKVIIQAAEINS